MLFVVKMQSIIIKYQVSSKHDFRVNALIIQRFTQHFYFSMISRPTYSFFFTSLCSFTSEIKPLVRIYYNVRIYFILKKTVKMSLFMFDNLVLILHDKENVKQASHALVLSSPESFVFCQNVCDDTVIVNSFSV